MAGQNWAPAQICDGAVGAMVLAGGQSRRMGTNKALLPFHESTFLETVLGELAAFPEVFVSADVADRYRKLGLSAVPDLIPGIGPLGGIYSGLSACRSQWLLVTTCDMPFFSHELAEYLVEGLSEEIDAAALVTRAGRVYPICAVYRKTALSAVRRQIGAGDYRVTALLDQLRVRFLSLRHTVFPDEILTNVNRPEDYRALMKEGSKPAVLAVSGIKNSGKTTLIAHLLPLLKASGLRVAVIKHDGHDFTPDVPGTDSYRFREAGADGVAVFSARRYLLTEARSPQPKELIERFQDMDLILLEGFKDSAFPKIEVVRGEVSSAPYCGGNLLAAVSDLPLELDIPVFGLDDAVGLAAWILEYTKGGDRNEGLLRQGN